MDFDSICAQHVDHDFEIARVSYLQQRRAGLDDGFALLIDLQHNTGDRRGHVPAFRRPVVAVPRQQGSRLAEFVLGGMILKFSSS
ncbi:hypothetical protein GALL_451040 [mine drainage metagenome]|uniref:Uncharacterized protein n=1 Tax=mine drainage metagenome TaxID=410659 RepID=A0A1J5QBB9_9ZZZZ